MAIVISNCSVGYRQRRITKRKTLPIKKERKKETLLTFNCDDPRCYEQLIMINEPFTHSGYDTGYAL